MSYDITFKVEKDGRYIDTGYCDANITWNVRRIIELSTGLPWVNEANNGLCVDVIPKIRQGLKNLLDHPEWYRRHEAPNGWGTVSNTAAFFRRILDAWAMLCVEQDDLIPRAIFWIE